MIPLLTRVIVKLCWDRIVSTDLLHLANSKFQHNLFVKNLLQCSHVEARCTIQDSKCYDWWFGKISQLQMITSVQMIPFFGNNPLYLFTGQSGLSELPRSWIVSVPVFCSVELISQFLCSYKKLSYSLKIIWLLSVFHRHDGGFFAFYTFFILKL